jgi:hypothetical protein
MAGTETFGPAAEIAIMISAEAAMAAVASHPVRRVSPDEAMRPSWVAAPLSSSLTESPVCRS